MAYRPDEDYYYHFDGLGSVIALSDENGDSVEVYNYDVYGAGIDEPVMMVVINRSADITGAGGVNAADLTDFADAWLSIAGLRYSAFDYNQDGYIGFDDLDWLCQKWLTAADFKDFAEFASLWLTEPGMSPDPGYNADADLYADGRIDFADFAVLAEYWLTDGERSDDYYYYHFDGLGSVIALSDEDGDAVETYDYDVFGWAKKISGVDNPYLFTGRRWDKETNLYYYRARMYNPAVGRFMQTDPSGYSDGTNLYVYVGNNPIVLVDPLGLDAYLIYEPHGGPRSFGRAGEKMGHVGIAVDSSDGDGKIVVGSAGYDRVDPPRVLENLEQASAYGKSTVIRFKNKTDQSWQSWETSDIRIEQYIYNTGYNNVSERAYIYCSNYAADALRFGGYDLESSGITPEVLVNAANAHSEWDSNIIPENIVK